MAERYKGRAAVAGDHSLSLRSASNFMCNMERSSPAKVDVALCLPSDLCCGPLPAPILQHRAVANTRSEPAPNFNFTSDWGDSLKANVDAEWRKKFMKSTYTAGNEDVVSYDLGFDVTKERAFHDWMLKQKTYYGDLLAKVCRGVQLLRGSKGGKGRGQEDGMGVDQLCV